MQGMMLYTILLSLGTVLASRITPRQQTDPGSHGAARNRLFLAVLFWLLFLPSALRLYTGNDYYTYIEHFHDVKLDHYVVTEPGFNLLVKLVYKLLGGEYFLVIFALFAAGTVFFSLRALYEQSADFAVSVFLYLALALYFQSYNTVRYYFALAIVLYSLRFVWEKEWEKFLLAVICAALFHKTALVVLLLYPLSRLHWRKWFYGILALGGISGLVFKAQYKALFLWLYPSYVNEEEYLNGDYFSIVNIARCLMIIILFLYLWQFEKEEVEARPRIAFYVRMNILALILFTCFSFVPFVSRIGYYLNVSQLLVVPELLACCKGHRRRILYGAVALAGMLYFLAFLWKADDQLVRILPYTTWLSVPDGMKPVF